MLDKNIKCGNSLISGNVLELNRYFGEDFHKVKPFSWEEEFKSVIVNDGGFDVVIGNPPWGADSSEENKKYLMEKFQYIHMRMPDSFNYFIGKSLTVVKKDGIVGVIIPNNYLFQHEYAKARLYILDNYDFNYAINLGDNVFAVTAPSCIIIVRNRNTKQKILKVTDLRDVERNILSKKIFEIKFDEIDNRKIKEMPDYIIPMNIAASEITSKILLKFPKTIDNICDEVASGISTGCDKAFRVDNKTIKEKTLEKDILYPVIIGREIHDYYSPESTDYKIIFTTRDTKKKDCPNIIKYLEGFSDKLSKRSEVKQELMPWWSLNRPRTHELFNAPKIILRQTADSIYAAIETKGYYCLDTILVIKLKNPAINEYKFLLALLNSSLLRWLYKNLTQETDRIFAQVKPINIRKLPIPELENSELKNEIVKIVDLIIGLKHKSITATSVSGNERDKIILKTHKEIDNLVYELYGITKEEMKIIENE